MTYKQMLYNNLRGRKYHSRFTVTMKVLSILISIFTTVSTQQQQGISVYAIETYYTRVSFTECLNGQLQETISNSLEYCYHGEWTSICQDDSQGNQVRERAISACTQLGYSDSRCGKLIK